MPKEAGRGRSVSNTGSSRVIFSAMRSALDHERSPSGPSANTISQSVSASTSAGGPAKRPRTDSPAPRGPEVPPALEAPENLDKAKTSLAEAIQEEQKAQWKKKKLLETCVYWEKEFDNWSSKGDIKQQVDDMIAQAMKKEANKTEDN